MERRRLNFADAVQGTPEIAECLKKGLQALGANSNKIKVRVTRDLKGSVDIDSCLAKLYPNAPVGITYLAIGNRFTTSKFIRAGQVK